MTSDEVYSHSLSGIRRLLDMDLVVEAEAICELAYDQYLDGEYFDLKKLIDIRKSMNKEEFQIYEIMNS